MPRDKEEFEPCRAEWCRRVDLHPKHSVNAKAGKVGEQFERTKSTRGPKPKALKARIAAHMKKMREANVIIQHKAYVDRLAHEYKERLELRGIKPKYEYKNEAGEILATEWTCPACNGSGWIGGCCNACYLCQGRAVVRATATEMFRMCVRQGVLK